MKILALLILSQLLVVVWVEYLTPEEVQKLTAMCESSGGVARYIGAGWGAYPSARCSDGSRVKMPR